MRSALTVLCLALLFAATLWSGDVLAVGREAIRYALDTYAILQFDMATLRLGCF